MINIDDFNYAWQLEEASKKLEKYVKTFELQQIGLTDALALNVCPEAEAELKTCMEKQAAIAAGFFHEECLQEINEIFPEGTQDLTDLLGMGSLIIT